MADGGRTHSLFRTVKYLTVADYPNGQSIGIENSVSTNPLSDGTHYRALPIQITRIARNAIDMFGPGPLVRSKTLAVYSVGNI